MPVEKSTRFGSELAWMGSKDFVRAVENLQRLKVVMSACLRDLNVMEVETKDYKKQRVSVKARGREDGGQVWTKVIWVPRKRIVYNRHNLEKLKTVREKINEAIPVMVQGHLRQVENPSRKQLEIAKEFGVVPLTPDCDADRTTPGEGHEGSRNSCWPGVSAGRLARFPSGPRHMPR